MKYPIDVDQETYNLLERVADRSRVAIDVAAAAVLKKGVQVLPVGRERMLVLSGPQLEAVESMLGGGSLLNGADAVKKVERLAGISFLHVRLPFTPSQLEQIADKAARNNQTVEELVERLAPRVYAQFFDLMGRS